MEKKKKAPMILWAYPREFKDKSSAGQSTANPNRFTYPNYGSAIYWVAKGYVVLDGAAFPIVGEGWAAGAGWQRKMCGGAAKTGGNRRPEERGCP